MVWGCQSSSPVPIVRSEEQFGQLMRQVRDDSIGPLRKFESGEELSEADRAALKRTRDIATGLRDYAPRDSAPHMILGKISRALGEDDTALTHYEEVARLLDEAENRSPADTLVVGEAFAEASRILLLQGDLNNALGTIERARELAPENPLYRVDQASVLIQKGEKKQARKLLIEAIAIDPAVPRASGLLKLIGD